MNALTAREALARAIAYDVHRANANDWANHGTIRKAATEQAIDVIRSLERRGFRIVEADDGK